MSAWSVSSFLDAEGRAHRQKRAPMLMTPSSTLFFCFFFSYKPVDILLLCASAVFCAIEVSALMFVFVVSGISTKAYLNPRVAFFGGLTNNLLRKTDNALIVIAWFVRGCRERFLTFSMFSIS